MDAARACSTSPTIASKRWVYRAVRLHGAHEHGRSGPAAATPPCSASAARPTALALKTDCNGRYVYLDPREGGTASRSPRRRATSPAPARGRWRSPTASTSATRRGPRSSSSSARRVAASPRRAARSARRSPAATSRSTTRARPAPSIRRRSIGMVGLLDDVAHVTRSAFQRRRRRDHPARRADRRARRERVPARGSTASSAGAPPACDLAAERALIDALLEAIGAGARALGARLQRRRARRRARRVLHRGPRARSAARRSTSRRGRRSRSRALLFGEAQGARSSSHGDAGRRARDRREARRARARDRHGRRRRATALVRSRRGRTTHRGRRSLGLARAYHDAIPARDAARARPSGRGRLATRSTGLMCGIFGVQRHARRGASSPISASTRCSTAGRSRPASSPSTRRRRRTRCARMGLVGEEFGPEAVRGLPGSIGRRPHALHHRRVVDARERAAGRSRASRAATSRSRTTATSINAAELRARARGRGLDLHARRSTPRCSST